MSNPNTAKKFGQAELRNGANNFSPHDYSSFYRTQDERNRSMKQTAKLSNLVHEAIDRHTAGSGKEKIALIIPMTILSKSTHLKT